MERGAHDFIAPPFATNELSPLLRSAADNALRRRIERAGAVAA